MRFLILLLIIFGLVTGFFLVKTASTFNVISISERSFWEEVSSFFAEDKNDERLDVLILGIRGRGDPNGGLLADGIILLSLDKIQKRGAVFSIPRDLYVAMPDLANDDGKEKLNFANAYGEQKKKGGGLLLSRALVSDITGIKIDYAISIDFFAFKEIVEWLGGIEIYRKTPFREHLQWLGEGKEGKSYWLKEDSGWTFYVPEGKNFLDGEAALYYVRSRFSTSDFDRSRRQQEVLFAIKEKALSLDLLANPAKILELFEILKKNIQTDMSIGDMKNLLEIAKDFDDIKEVKNVVLDTSENGLLHESFNKRGEYILLPRYGNWNEIRSLIKGVFGTRDSF